MTLRNISINGGTSVSPGFNGIRYIQGARLNVENVTIFNFTSGAPNGFGILIAPTAGANEIHVTNSIIRNNGAAASGGGIGIAPTGAASVQLSIYNVELTNNYRGLDLTTTGTSAGNTVVFATGAIFSSTDNAVNGTTNANALQIMFQGVTIANNLRGVILAGAGAAARIGEGVISGNGPAMAVSGGAVIQSYRNGQIDFNGNNTTPIPQATPN